MTVLVNFTNINLEVCTVLDNTLDTRFVRDLIKYGVKILETDMILFYKVFMPHVKNFNPSCHVGWEWGWGSGGGEHEEGLGKPVSSMLLALKKNRNVAAPSGMRSQPQPRVLAFSRAPAK